MSYKQKVFTQICNIIQQKGYILDTNDTNDLWLVFDSIDFTKVRNMDNRGQNNVLKLIIMNYVNYLENKRTTSKKISEFVTRPSTKPVVYQIETFLGATNAAQLNRTINPGNNYRYAYLCLDSDNSNEFNQENVQQISWKYSSGQLQQPNTIGTIYTYRPIKNIRAIRLSSCLFPYKSTFDYDVLFNVSVLIEEFKSQVVPLSGNKDGCHFIFPIQISRVGQVFNNTTSLYNLIATPYQIVYFDPPIQEFSSLTLKFADPIIPIVFDLRRPTEGVPTSYFTDYLSFDVNAPSANIVPIMYCTGYTTTEPERDAALISYVNNNAIPVDGFDVGNTLVSYTGYNTIRTVSNTTKLVVPANKFFTTIEFIYEELDNDNN